MSGDDAPAWVAIPIMAFFFACFFGVWWAASTASERQNGDTGCRPAHYVVTKKENTPRRWSVRGTARDEQARSDPLKILPE